MFPSLKKKEEEGGGGYNIFTVSWGGGAQTVSHPLFSNFVAPPPPDHN